MATFALNPSFLGIVESPAAFIKIIKTKHRVEDSFLMIHELHYHIWATAELAFLPLPR